MTTSSADAISPDVLSVFIKLQYFMITASSLLFIALLALIWREKAVGSMAWTEVANPFNGLLVAISLFQIIWHISLSIKCWGNACTYAEYEIAAFVVEDVAIYGVVQCYMMFAWMRGNDVLKKMFPKFMGYFQWVIRLSPAMFVATVVADTFVTFLNLKQKQSSRYYVLFNLIDMVMTVVAGLTAVMFDITVFVAFVYYLRNLSTEAEISLDGRLKIIAQFGAVTSLLGITAFVFNVLGKLFPTGSLNHILLLHVVMLCLDLVVLLLIVMKFCLINQRGKVNSNISISDLNNIGNNDDGAPPMGLLRYLASMVFGMMTPSRVSLGRSTQRTTSTAVMSTALSRNGSSNPLGESSRI